jgi:hypothetical protein
MPAARAAGVLAIWNDCTPGGEVEYEHWYRSEHLAERVAIDGFVAGWRFAAVDAAPAYFTHYETVSPEVLFSAAYLARVNDPTALTRRIMSGVFVNATRTVCERVLRSGDSRGAFATTLRFDDANDRERVIDALPALAQGEDVLRAEVWARVEGPELPPSAEQGLRAPDGTMAVCLVLESADERAARAAAEAARAALPAAASCGVYRMLCSLHRADQA